MYWLTRKNEAFCLDRTRQLLRELELLFWLSFLSRPKMLTKIIKLSPGSCLEDLVSPLFRPILPVESWASFMSSSGIRRSCRQCMLSIPADRSRFDTVQWMSVMSLSSKMYRRRQPVTRCPQGCLCVSWRNLKMSASFLFISPYKVSCFVLLFRKCQGSAKIRTSSWGAVSGKENKLTIVFWLVIFVPDQRPQSCTSGRTLTCSDGLTRICEETRCDGRLDCPGGEDEENCGRDDEGEWQWVRSFSRVWFNNLHCIAHSKLPMGGYAKLLGWKPSVQK